MIGQAKLTQRGRLGERPGLGEIAADLLPHVLRDKFSARVHDAQVVMRANDVRVEKLPVGIGEVVAVRCPVLLRLFKAGNDHIGSHLGQLGLHLGYGELAVRCLLQ